MIEIQAKIHDKFSVEFKVGFITRKRLAISDFVMNTWIFVPHSLDINPMTYDKTRFYRDIKSNVRLVTPVYLLRDLATTNTLPFQELEKSFRQLSSTPTRTATAEYESQIKMFASILKSALRDEYLHIVHNTIEKDCCYLTRDYITNIRNVVLKFRNLRKVINVSTVPANTLEYFHFGDEFISNVIEQHVNKLQDFLSREHPQDYLVLKKTIQELLKDELNYKREKNYATVNTENKTNNREFILRAGMLKKYIESDLYLIARKKRNTFLLEQILFSLAAGMSMVFATIVSFSFQQKYGNFTLPFFIALVISYMLKDRIKELMRFYFAHKLGSKFYDNKVQISNKSQQIGWSKEGFDFISDNKVPREVMELRGRSSLLEAENRRVDEKIILYRKRVQLNRKQLVKISTYPIPGIHDIIRFNISEFIRKMDNPEVPIFGNDKDGNSIRVHGEKTYYLNFVIQCQYEEQLEYKRYRIMFNRLGIKKIETF
ncbi:MAG TPA: hypothetical protein K8V05_15660 [Butyricimonas virosa]|uniref:Uncharacterized protein n=1 Tax=Butyricimonas virosa TaxID=544645 RepID=A0A921KZT9_9BACT|nr:hypothetical protein [Butyricimonas virosa]